MLSRLALNFASVLSSSWHGNWCHCTSCHIAAGMVGVVILTPSRTAVLHLWVMTPSEEGHLTILSRGRLRLSENTTIYITAKLFLLQ